MEDLMEGRWVDQRVGRREGRLEDQRADQMEAHWVGRRAVHSGDLMEGHLADLRGGLSVPEVPRTKTALLQVLVRGRQCRQKHRPACCQVAIALPQLAIFLQMSFLSPRWHPFHPHGAA